MKKSTILLILIVYLASIVAIGFFGMASKVYDEIKYVKAIEMEVEAEKEESYLFQSAGTNKQGNKIYNLYVFFDQADVGAFERENGFVEERKFVALTLIPHVTYDTGDVANAEEESIVYRLNDTTLQEKEHVNLEKNGMLYCFKETSFRVYVEPASQSSNDVAVIIDIYVI